MSVTFTQLSQTLNLAEKVKVDSGEKIVKTDKVGRKKNIEVTISTKGGKFFVYFDGEKYAGSYRNEKDAQKVVKDYLKLVGEELQENRAKRDAMRAMGRRRGKDAADIDDFATDDDRKAADKNIMMQLRKAVSLRGMKPIEFADGKKAKINPKDAEKLLAIYDKLKPASKLQLQTVLAKSKRDFDKAVQKLKENEYFDESIEEGKMKQISMYIDDIVTAMSKDRTLKPFAKKFKADAEKSKDPKKSLEKILPDYIPGKQVAGLLNMGEEILSNDELGYIAEMLEELQEGTWALPDSSKKKQGLKKAMSKPIKLGKGGDDAISVVGEFIGDDELYDDLGVAGDKNPNGDARPIVSKWMKKNFKGSWSKYAIEEVELDESKMKSMAQELNIDKKDVDKLKALMVMYTRAMKIPSGSPKHDALSREISKLRKELNMEEVELEEALPPHLAKLFDKDGNFKDPKKQKVFDKMMGDGIGKEIAQKMGRIKFRVDADSRNKKIKVYVDSNDEKDAQRALKMHPAYVSGALRVVPEEVGKKVECPQCKGEGCDHCQGKGYHLTEVKQLDEKFKVGDKVKVKKGSLKSPSQRHYEKTVGTIMKDYKDGDFKVNFGGNDNLSIEGKFLVKEETELDEVGGSAFGGTIDKIQKVVDDKQAMKIDGVMVDMFTASLIMKIFKKVNKQNQDRMRKMKVTQLANAAYKLAGVKEEIELDEAIKYTHVAVDAKGKIIGFASKADDAKDMARRNKGVVHKLKKPMSQKVGDMEINRPFNPVLKASMNFKDFMKSK